VIEQPEVDRLRRELRAFTAKANDPEGLAATERLAAEFAEMRAFQARKLTSEGDPRPHTWAEIGRPLGITRQAAHKRYAARKGSS
jgi:hypothetical protein